MLNVAHHGLLVKYFQDLLSQHFFCCQINFNFKSNLFSWELIIL